jgi:acetyltransferase-like isoleucine patch superfamily enzyme
MKYLQKIPSIIHTKKFQVKFILGKLNYLNAIWWGIELGKNCQFKGKTHFFKTPESNIRIDVNCIFLSSFTSNKIGINHPCTISTLGPGASLTIGKSCGFSGVSIGCFEKIVIGDNVRVGANVLITDSDWHLDDPRIGLPSPVMIGNNVWLGYGATILKGVSIGENTIIGANSVVVSDIPDNVIAAGNPCKIIKSLV